jgi:predicted PurR-regulated permease PerM
MNVQSTAGECLMSHTDSGKSPGYLVQRGGGQAAEQKTTALVVSLLSVIAIVMGAMALRALSSILIPLVLAVFLCYLLLPVMGGLAKRGIPEKLTLPVTLVFLVGCLFVLDLVVVKTTDEIVNRVPFYVERIESLSAQLLTTFGEQAEVFQEVDWVGGLSGAAQSLTVGLFGNLITFVINLILVFTYTGFILIGRKSLKKNLERAFSSDRARDLQKIVEQVNGKIQQYIATKISLSLLTGFLMFVVLASFGVDFALFWGLLAFLLNFIPSLGSAVAVLLPIFVALLQFESSINVLWLGIILLIIQQVIGNVLEPAIQGNQLNMSPIIVLFSLVFFGWLWGFWGMVLSVPLVSALKIILENSTALKPIAILMEK